jgi:hypothetical protein
MMTSPQCLINAVTGEVEIRAKNHMYDYPCRFKRSMQHHLV